MFLVLVLLTFDVSYGWMNALDKPLSYICPNGKAIFEINSKHDNFYEDRVFDIQCRSTGRAVGGCQWTDYVNNFDQPFNFQCPGQSALFGLQSEHDNTYEDRRWKFYCCDLPGVQLADCYSTPHSEYDRAFSVLAPNNNVIRGVSSVVDNYYQTPRGVLSFLFTTMETNAMDDIQIKDILNKNTKYQHEQNRYKYWARVNIEIASIPLTYVK